MPALPPVPNVVKVVIEGTTPLFPWANVLHWSYTGAAPSNANCQAFAAVAIGAWQTQFAPLMVTGSEILKAIVTDLSSATGGEGEAGDPVAGTRGVAELPASTCALVHKGIGRRYRGGHPRSYIFCGIQTDLADSAHWGSDFVAEVELAYVDFGVAMTGSVAGGTTLALEATVSYIDKAINPVPPYRRPVPAVFPVTGTSVEAELAQQRRRIGR